MKCATRFCTRKVKAKGLCAKCYNRYQRKNNPIQYAYQTLKDNSKRRGKEFLLTLEEFTQFCIKTEYIKGKGKKSESYSIDRIDNTKGYIVSNIRILTLSENSRKGTKVLEAYWDEYERRLVAKVIEIKNQDSSSEDCLS